MRISWLLVSIAVHGAAVTAAVGFDVFAKRPAPQSPARIEIQRQDESASAPSEESWTPSVTSENVYEDVVLLEPKPPVFLDDRPLPSPSEIMQLANLERVVPEQWVEAQQRSDNKAPVYPEKEHRLGREGRVLLQVSVSAYGLVDNVLLLEPSRYPGFNRAALEAAREWRFMPATQGGVAVASQTDIPVVFRLTDDE